MFSKFQPTWQVESIYDLPPEELRKKGIKVVLTDLDNTLIAWNNPDGTPQLREWLQKMEEAKIPVVVVSNNSFKRVERAVRSLGLPFVSRAMKPFARGLKIAVKRYGLKKHEIVLVGDQLMTDVASANNFGIRCILVKPLVKSDAWNTKINRFLENIVKKRLLKENKLSTTWRHDLND